MKGMSLNMNWLLRKPKVKPSNHDTITEKIAKIRGIEDVDRFLNPTKDELHDPYLMKNIEEASDRIIFAIQNKEKIVLSYDPDADGLTATSIMYRYLRKYTDNVEYIYGERNDGHGITEQLKTDLNVDIEENAKRLALNLSNVEKVKNADLLIIIDSSSNDVETCKYIVNAGIDVVILDHHAIERSNSYVILVNPQQEGCKYPNKQLSGAGVVFKTIQVIEDVLDEVDPFQFMDLVAVGMYSDVMRMDVLENRFMVMHGLRNLKNAGLIRILKGGKVDTFKINCNAIGFTIAPLLNGSARMDNIKLAIDILLKDDDNILKPIRLKMDKLNQQRKLVQKELSDKYSKKVDSSQKVLFVLDEQSSKGFNGLVAQNLSDQYKRPAIVGRLHKGTASGSFRSIGKLDFKNFLLESGLVEEAMGHPSAGGFTVKEENLEALKDYIDNNLPEIENKNPYTLYDLEVDVGELNEYIGIIEQFNLIVGNGFPKIIIKVNNITIEEVECIGKTRETVKFKTFDNLELIKFRVNEDYASELTYFDSISAVGQLQMNEFYHFGLKQKISTMQIMIEDYKLN